MKKLILTLILAITAPLSFAGSPEKVKKIEPGNLVNWIGYVDADYGHNTKHKHNMKFVRQSDGETFDIVDSPDLEKTHCESSKKLLVEITAERTPRVLFWGNNLMVKNFKILNELEGLPHKKYVPRENTSRGDRI